MHGIVSIQVEATPTIGLREGLGVEADAVQVGARGRALGALGEGAAAVLEVEAGPRSAHGAGTRTAAVRVAAGAAAARALALPLAQAPQVALDLARVDLAAGQVHVRRLDQPPLVAGERHPLREHVVGVGQPRRCRRGASRPGTRRSTR